VSVLSEGYLIVVKLIFFLLGVVHVLLLVSLEGFLNFKMTSEGEIVVELLSQLCLLDLEENFI